MNTPCILNKESTMEGLVRNKYDALFAETPESLFCQMMFLRKNKNFFNKMIVNCKKRANENSHDVITAQFIKFINNITSDRLKKV